MVEKVFIPQRGDIIRLTFDPQVGHEQSGWRPGLVLSNFIFNEATGLCVVCPITNTNRGYPFHVHIINTPKITGVVMVDQIKSVDYIYRKATLITKVSQEVIEEVVAIYKAILRYD